MHNGMEYLYAINDDVITRRMMRLAKCSPRGSTLVQHATGSCESTVCRLYYLSKLVP